MIDNQRIDRIGHSEQSKSFKFLGIYIDEKIYHGSIILKRSALKYPEPIIW